MIAASVLAGIATALLRVIGGWDLASPVLAGLSVFLSWALARELDPDSHAAAVLAAFGGLALFLVAPPSLRIVTAVLFAVRLVAGTTGTPPTILDLIWLPVVSAWSAGARGGIPAALALALALATCGRRQLPSAAAALALTIAVATAGRTPALEPSAGPRWAWLVIGFALLAAVPLLLIRTTRAVGDMSGQPLAAGRVFAARLAAVGTGAATVAWLGATSATTLGCLWVAFIGSSAARVLSSRRSAKGCPPAAASEDHADDRGDRQERDRDP